MLAEKHRATAQARDLVRLDPLIIDTETTGMDDDDQVVELAATDLQGNALIATLVRATVPVKPEAREVHGIGDADLNDAPALSDALRNLQRLAGDRPLAAYNAPFDQRMLRNSLLAQRAWNAHSDLLADIHCIMRLYPASGTIGTATTAATASTR